MAGPVVLAPVSQQPQPPRPRGAIVPAEPYQRGLTWLVGLGHDPQVLLAKAGIRPELLADPAGLLTLDQVEAFVLVAAEMVNERGRALELGGRLLFPAYGDVGFAALTASSVADAFQVAERYLELISPLFLLTRARVRNFLRAELSAAYPLDDTVLLIHIQVILSTLHALVRHGLGKLPEGLEVAIPIEDEPLLEWLRSQDVKVRSSVGSIAVWIPEHLADASFLLADADAHAVFVARCDERLRSRHTPHPMTRAVRRALRGGGPEFRDVRSVAQLLQESPRSIQRRLEEEGTTFHQLLTEARFSWAASELAGSARPVTAIGYDLGYSTAGTFTRAFVRATGVSPTEYRRRALQKPIG